MSGCFDYLWKTEERFQSDSDKQLKKYLSNVWDYHLILESGQNMSKEDYDAVILRKLQSFVKIIEGKLVDKKNQQDAKKLLELMK